MLGIVSSIPAGKHFALIVDNDGNVVWHRRFVGGVVDFQRQPNGHYTAYTSVDASPSRFYEMDKFGTILRDIIPRLSTEPGPHELRMTDEGYYLFSIEFRHMDLRTYGGRENARVRGMNIEYERSVGTPFTWSTFDHLQVTDAAPDIDLTALNVNPWHGNAIELDADGNMLVSFRNMDEVTKINTQTGGIIWRLGGRRSQFRFVNDPLSGFSHQHGVRRLANGNIILFDNGNLHVPPLSRPVEYRLDESTHTAELVWEYRHDPPLYGSALGFAQRLENGSTLICYGLAQRVIEVDMSGTVQWDLQIDEPLHYAYRAFRIKTF